MKGSRRHREAATRPPSRLLPGTLLALAAALALLLAGGLDTANAQGTGVVKLTNFGQPDTNAAALATFDAAQSFTTGTSETGYALTSVELMLQTNADPNGPTVKLFSGSANGTEVATFSLQGSLTPSTTAGYTFLPTSSVTLDDSTPYWVVVEGGDTSLRLASSEKVDPASSAGWSLTGRLETRAHDATGDYAPRPNPRHALMVVNGYALAGIKASNLNQEAESWISIFGSREWAQAFCTGDIATTLTRVRMYTALSSSRAGAPVVTIRSDDSGAPGAVLHTLTNPALDKDLNTHEDFTSAGYRLSASTRYWLTVHAPESSFSHSFIIGTSESMDDDPETYPGWSIVDRAQVNYGEDWEEYRVTTQIMPVVIYGPVNTRMAVYASGGEGTAIMSPAFADRDCDGAADLVELAVDENVAAGTVVGTVAAYDLDGDSLTYSVAGTDATRFAGTFELDAGTGEITVKSGAAIDYEALSAYGFTFEVTDGEDSTGASETDATVDATVAVRVGVTNINEPGVIIPSTPSLTVGQETVFALHDPDHRVVNDSITLARGDTADGDFTVFKEVPFMPQGPYSYTPETADEGKFLRVTFVYWDVHGWFRVDSDLPYLAFMRGPNVTGDNTAEWTSSAAVAASMGQEAANTPAGGFAGITGSGFVGETFTATTSDITDTDGMTNAVFTYQWKRGELGGSDEDAVNIATGQSYTLTSEDEGKEIWVVVSFTDDRGALESVPSNKYIISPAIEEQQGDDGSATECVGEGLTADLLDHPDSHDGDTPFTFELCFTQEPARGLSFRTIRDYVLEVTDGTIDHVRRLERGSGKRWQVTVDPAGDADVVVVQKPTISNCESWRAVCTPDGAKLSGSESFTVKGPASQEPANSVPTGEPEIDGTLRVGSTLTATTSNIADADGMTEAAFTYQWKRIDPTSTDTEGEDITGATEQTYVVTSGDVDNALRVVVTFTDDADNVESLPSPATETVTDAPPAHTDRPYNLRAVVQDGAVVLSWEEPDITRQDADDYRIMRHRPELGEPDPLMYVDTYSSATTYTDTAVEPGVLYVYRVHAVIDFFGELSEASDPVEIRTPGQPQEQQTNEQTEEEESEEQQTEEQVYDFDAGDGQRVLAGARIRVGDRGRKNNEDHDRAWYATDTTDWHASGELLDGSLAWNGMTVNRVVYFPDTDVFRLNDPRDDFDLGASFQEGGVNRELTIWVQTATDKVSFLAKDHIVNSGGHWINFRVPEAIRTVLDGIAAADEITIAVSVPDDP